MKSVTKLFLILIVLSAIFYSLSFSQDETATTAQGYERNQEQQQEVPPTTTNTGGENGKPKNIENISIRNLQEKLIQLEEANKQLTTTKDILEKKINSLSIEKTSLGSDLESIQEKYKTLKDDVIKKGEDIANRDEAIEVLTNTNENYKRDLLEAEKIQKETEMKLNGEIILLKQEMKLEKTKRLELEEDKETTMAELAKLSREIGDLEEDNKGLKKNVENLDGKLKDEKTRANYNRKFMRQYYAELKKVKAELKKKQTELLNLENQIKNKDETIKSKDKKLSLITDLEEKNRSFGKVLVYIVAFILLSVFFYIAYIYRKKIHGQKGDEDYRKFCPDDHPITKEIVRQLLFYDRASYWVRRSMELTFFLLFSMMVIFTVLLIVEGAPSLILFVNMNFWVVVSAIGFPFVTITSTYNIVESKKNEVLKMLAEHSKA